MQILLVTFLLARNDSGMNTHPVKSPLQMARLGSLWAGFARSADPRDSPLTGGFKSAIRTMLGGAFVESVCGRHPGSRK
jgi:hypothetical protein